MFKRLLACVLVVMFLTMGKAIEGMVTCVGFFSPFTIGSAFADGDFVIDENGILTKYNGSATSIVIDDERITSIGNYAFSGKETIKTIEIQSEVTTIGTHSFSGCTDLETITFPETLTAIGSSAFNRCNKLGRIDLPDNVISLKSGNYSALGGYNGLVYCNPDSVTARTVSEVNHDFYVGDDTSFGLRYILVDEESTLALYSYTGSATKVEIPDYVEAIYNSTGTFRGNAGIVEVVIPASITTIPASCFSDCTNLETITFPETLTAIGSSAFNRCNKLGRIDLPDNVTSLKSGNYSALDGYNGLVYCNPDSVTARMMSKLNKSFHINNDTLFGLRYVTIEEKEVLTIYEYTGDDETAEIVVPNYAEAIYNRAFYGNTQLERITISSGIKTIGSYAFSECVGLKNVIMQGTVESIGSNCFYNCTNLETITLPETLKAIEGSAFSGCSKLEKIELPDNVTSLRAGDETYSNALYQYNGLVYCNPDSMTARTVSEVNHDFYVGDDTSFGLRYIAVDEESKLALYSYTGSATKVEIPDCVEAIYNSTGVFRGNASITEVVIPASITTIPASCFSDCTNLETITLPETLKAIEGSALSGCSKLEKIELPDNVTSLRAGNETYSNAFYQYNGLVYCNLDSVTARTVSEVNHDFYVGDDTSFGLRYIAVDEESKLALYSYTGSAMKVEIPDYVEAIYNSTGTLRGNTNITEVVIPAGVTMIPASCFSGCTSLETITFPETMTAIGSSAFNGCSKLGRIDLPDNVTSLKNGDFSALNGYNGLVYCNLDSVTARTVSEVGHNFYVDDDTSFGLRYITDNGESKLALKSYTGSATEVVVPAIVATIGSHCFYKCTSLEVITLPDTLTSIQGFAFSYCTNLTRIYLPDNVTNLIGGSSGAFVYCDAKIHCNPQSETAKVVSSIGKEFYVGDDFSFGLRYIDDELTIYKYTGDKTVTEITVPNYADTIYDRAFRNQTQLEKVRISSGIRNIKFCAFAECSALKEIDLGDTVEKIGQFCFSECENLTAIKLSDSLSTLESYAFYLCINLPRIDLPDNVTSIMSYGAPNGFTAFVDCNALLYCNPHSTTAITLSNRRKSFYIGDDTSYGLRIINNKITLYTYTGNDRIVELPDYIEDIDYNAFYENSNIEELIISDSCQLTKYNVIAPLKKTLKRIILPDSISEITSYMFSGFEVLTEIIVPEGVTSIANHAVINCPLLDLIELPRTITVIGDGNFLNCPFIQLKIYPDSFSENWAVKNAVPYIYNSQKAIVVTVSEDDATVYNGLSLVLSNNETEYKRIMDGSLQYTFFGTEELTQCQISVKNALGYPLSDTHEFTVMGNKTEIQLPAIYDNFNVHLTVRDISSKNITDSTNIIWTDENGNFIADGQDLYNC